MSESVETAPVAASKGKIVEALVRLGKAVQKSTIYPDGHPAVPAAVRVFLESLKAALEDKSDLTLGVACDRILLDGEAVEPKNAALTWVAQHMYERGIGVIDFARSTPEEECVRFVQWLAKPPITEVPAEGLPTFEGLSLTRYDYARVRFGEDPTTDSEIRKDPVRVWLALMSGLIVGDSDAALTLSEDPEEAARQICLQTASGEIGAAAVASRVLAMGQHLSSLAEPVKEAVKKRIGRFIGGLTQELRSELLRVDPRCSRQKLEFVTEMVDALPNTMVVEILGDLDRTGGHVPHQFITLMNKLIGLSARDAALHEEVSSKLESIGVPKSLLQTDPDKMRAVLEEVLQSRIGKNYNPERYQVLLENLSMKKVGSGEPISLPDRYGDPCAPEDVLAHVSEIVLQMLVARPDCPEAASFLRCLDEDAPRAIETERFDQVHRSARAVKTIVSEHPQLPAALLEQAGSYLGGFSKEERIEKILTAAMEGSGAPPPSIVGLFQISGVEAAYRAVHKLVDLSDGPEMRTLTDLLVSLEPEVFNAAVARLRQEGWASLRVLFPVLHRLGGTRAVELALTFMGNEDPRVRIEAFRILLADDQRPGQFERYLERALADDSSRVAGFGLAQVRGRTGSEVTQILAAFLKRGADDELRLKAISILGALKTPEGRDVLVAMLARRKIVLWVKQVKVVNALEEALVQIGDDVAQRAVRSWRRSPARWLSLLLVQGKVEKK